MGHGVALRADGGAQAGPLDRDDVGLGAGGLTEAVSRAREDGEEGAQAAARVAVAEAGSVSGSRVCTWRTASGPRRAAKVFMAWRGAAGPV